MIVHRLMWSQHATDGKKRKRLVLRKHDRVKFLTSFFTTAQRQKKNIKINFSHFHTLMFQCWLFSFGAQRQGVQLHFTVKLLVFTKSVDSDFRSFWLAPVTRNILGYRKWSFQCRSRISVAALIWIYYNLTPHLCYGACYRLRNKTSTNSWFLKF